MGEAGGGGGKRPGRKVSLQEGRNDLIREGPQLICLKNGSRGRRTVKGKEIIRGLSGRRNNCLLLWRQRW